MDIADLLLKALYILVNGVIVILPFVFSRHYVFYLAKENKNKLHWATMIMAFIWIALASIAGAFFITHYADNFLPNLIAIIVSAVIGLLSGFIKHKKLEKQTED